MTAVDREALLSALQTLKPAWATRDTIEQLTLAWFDGETITASNETGLGMQVTFKSDALRGGLKGSMLLAVMSNSRAKEVNMEKDDTGFFIKAGKTKLTLPMPPLKDMLAEVPNTEDGKAYEVSTDVFGIIGRVLISLGPANSATPEQTGVTLLVKKGKLYAFTSDSATIACAYCDTPKSFSLKEGERVILPADFIARLLSISKGVKTMLHIGKESVWAKTEEALVFSRVIHAENPIDLLEIVTDIGKKIEYVPIPGRLRLALARSEALTSDKSDMIEFSVFNQVLRLSTQSAHGALTDSMGIEGVHAKIKTKLNPRMLKRALPYSTHIGFGEKASAMEHDKLGFVYIIAPNKQ